MQFLTDFAEQLSSFVLKWIEVVRQQDIVVDPGLLLLLAGVITLWLGCASWSSSIAEARGYGARLHFFIGLLLPIIYPPIALLGLGVKKSGHTAAKPKEKAGKKPEAQKKSIKPDPPSEPAPAEHGQAEHPQPPKETREDTEDEEIPNAPDLIIPEDTPSGEEDGKPHSSAATVGPSLHPLRKRSAAAAASTSGEVAANQPREFNQSLFRKMAEEAENSGARFRIRYAGGREVTALDIVETTAQHVVVNVDSDEGSSQRVRIPYARVEAVEPAE